jgi:hypothetical protein
MVSLMVDRRSFIVAAGAAGAVAYLPAATPAAPAVGSAEPQQLADWHIDDMWGVYPRPSEPIGFGRPRADGLRAAHHAVDAGFVVV